MPETAPHLILASASPRRQELLREAGYEFETHPANVNEEDFHSDALPIEIAEELSRRKAAVVAQKFRNDLVLAADTVVAFGDKPLGKPRDPNEARRMLALLAGTTHIVITGVTVMRASKGLKQTRVAMSAVRMKPLTAAEIDTYVASWEWQGKAGGYGIQDRDPFVIKVSGSHTNVVGLPMEITSEMLATAGIFPREGGEDGKSRAGSGGT
jgi:septum formation protein